MLAVYALAALLCAASLIAGRAVLVALGRREWTWLSAPVGLAALVVVAQPLVRLPGRGATAAAVVAVLLAVGLALAWRRPPAERAAELLRAGLTPALIVIVAASLPFVVNGRVGVLGEGVYTNDHAAQLFWAEWLATGLGAEPRGIELGYPLGPQSLAAILAEGTGASLETAFNGLLLAIPVLTALASLAVLRDLPPVRRAIAASLTGLPYLAASFLAQSAFKETAMALFVVGLAVGLADLNQPRDVRAHRAVGESPQRADPRRGVAATLVALGLLALAGVLTFSLAGLVWPALAVAIWLGLELATGRIELSPRRVAAALRPLWPALAAGLALLVVLAAAQAGAVSGFLERLGDIQATTGRLFSSVSPREALGVWPEGDFRTDASGDPGAVIATLVGLAAAAFAAWWWWWRRRRELAVPATLAGAILVYAGARVLGGIHVEAKALAVMAPVAMLFVLRALLSTFSWERSRGIVRFALATLAVVFVAGAAGSTFLALRAAPVGTEARAAELEQLRAEVEGKPVLLLVADRFAPYRLRGAKVGSPGGYVPSRELNGRPGKRWDQGRALEFDSVTHEVLNGYRYVITTNAPYASTPPPEFEPVRSTPSYTLWRRGRRVPARGVVEPPDKPGAALDCGRRGDRELSAEDGTATVLPAPVVGPRKAWRPASSFELGESASQTIELAPGRWDLSLQYHSPVGLVVEAPGLREQLPASLDGMYGFAPGEGQFWPAGTIDADRGGPLRFTVRARELPWAGRVLGAERTSWVGALALTRPDGAHGLPLADACGRYVDRYRTTR
jgi:hypothetical protein